MLAVLAVFYYQEALAELVLGRGSDARWPRTADASHGKQGTGGDD